MVKVAQNAAFVFILISITFVFFPSFWVHVFMLVDFYTPWLLFESELYDSYHHFLVSRLPERPELPLLEIEANEANLEHVRKITKDFSWPVVIRGLLGNESTSEGIRNWGSPKWWVDHYPDEKLLCGTLTEVVENCTIAAFFDAIENGKPFYVSGASVIVQRHPELHDMIDSEQVRNIEPGTRSATQIFMGIPQMGTDIHAAMGINVFRQIVGDKKWWFIPPSQTAYLKPAINVNGFSVHTRTLLGKEEGQPSPWFTKIERYTSVLHPGDVLINPPWFWHGIINMGDRKDKKLIIGCASRYGAGYTLKPAFINNPLFVLNGILTIFRRHGLKALLNRSVNLQGDIANDRRNREKKPLVAVTDVAESFKDLDLGE